MTVDYLTKKSGRREPAARIIALLGGDESVAKLLSVSRSTVTKFASAGKDGRDGEIPRQYRPKLIKAAAKLGVILKPEDFAWRPPPRKRAGPVRPAAE